MVVVMFCCHVRDDVFHFFLVAFVFFSTWFSNIFLPGWLGWPSQALHALRGAGQADWIQKPREAPEMIPESKPQAARNPNPDETW